MLPHQSVLTDLLLERVCSYSVTSPISGHSLLETLHCIRCEVVITATVAVAACRSTFPSEIYAGQLSDILRAAQTWLQQQQQQYQQMCLY